MSVRKIVVIIRNVKYLSENRGYQFELLLW